jgi:hypothetical protein
VSTSFDALHEETRPLALLADAQVADAPGPRFALRRHVMSVLALLVTASAGAALASMVA